MSIKDNIERTFEAVRVWPEAEKYLVDNMIACRRELYSPSWELDKWIDFELLEKIQLMNITNFYPISNPIGHYAKAINK